MRNISIFAALVLIAVVSVYLFRNNFASQISTQIGENKQDNLPFGENNEPLPHPLSIESLRMGEFPGSQLTIEQTLPSGSNYQRYIASYKSEGLKIYGLLTIPNSPRPQNGYPTIIFNHGYIPPTEYRTTERYIAYTDAFSRNGYVLFRPDYRGHGNSEGTPSGGYGSNDYTIDVLNAVSSIKNYPINLPGQESVDLVDNDKIGMWGHSMGGHITLRNMVVNKDIKAGVIWAGVVASYPDLINNWRRGNNTPTPQPTSTNNPRRWRQSLVDQFGEPSEDSPFWRSISSDTYLEDISGPLQIHHGTADTSVPVEFSQKLEQKMKSAGKTVEYYEYPGDDHDISSNFSLAINRSVEFFDKYLK